MKKILLLIGIIFVLSSFVGAEDNECDVDWDLNSCVSTEKYQFCDDGWVLNNHGYKIIHESTIKQWASSSNNALITQSRSWQTKHYNAEKNSEQEILQEAINKKLNKNE